MARLARVRPAFASQLELPDDLSEPSLNRRVILHPPDDMRQHARFENHAAVDELLRIGFQQARMKAQMLGDSLHVDAPDGQPDPGLRLDDAEKLKRLGGLTQTQPTDAKRLRKLSLRRQPITMTEFLLDDELLDLTGNLIANFGTTQRLHEVPLDSSFVRRGCDRAAFAACSPNFSSIDYLTI